MPPPTHPPPTHTIHTNNTQADPHKLGTVEVSAGSRTLWGRGGGVTVPLDAGNIHHFLATTDNEEARRQVGVGGFRVVTTTMRRVLGRHGRDEQARTGKMASQQQ